MTNVWQSQAEIDMRCTLHVFTNPPIEAPLQLRRIRLHVAQVPHLKISNICMRVLGERQSAVEVQTGSKQARKKLVAR